MDRPVSVPEKPWTSDLEAVRPGQDIDWQEAYYKLCAAIQDDMRPLLQALGMFDGARPESPREVLHDAARRAQELRTRLEDIAFQIGIAR
jgi:hypothetical protein